MDAYKEAEQWVREAKNIVFFGGAGTSTASGIPDFRSDSGLYNQSEEKAFSPEYALSNAYMEADPDGFSSYYKRNLVFPDAKPSDLHKTLVRWEKERKLLAVITQNIDRLHQEAGSENVIEIHGNLADHYCTDCEKKYPLEYAMKFEGAAICERCGGFVRPDVVLYGEILNNDALERAIDALGEADVLIVAGTSLVVYPAAGLLRFYEGDRLILINKGETPRDSQANLVFREDIGTVLNKISGGNA